MTELYSQTQLDQTYTLRKKTVFTACFCFGFALILCVVACFFVRYDNLLTYKIVGCCILLVLGWISLYLLTSVVVKYNVLIAKLKTVLCFDTKRVDCVVDSIGLAVTLRNGFSAYEINTADGQLFYWDLDLGLPPFAPNTALAVRLVNNFIVAYEVKQ